jgi:hypothetical protein
MHNAAMSFDIKALLTLLLLKQGTSSKDIQTAVNLTAAARLMVAEQYAETAPSEDLEAGNVTSIRPARRSGADTVSGARPFEPHADAMNSDIKALLMMLLLLLQNGASSREIQTTLRLAARPDGRRSAGNAGRRNRRRGRQGAGNPPDAEAGAAQRSSRAGRVA